MAKKKKKKAPAQENRTSSPSEKLPFPGDGDSSGKRAGSGKAAGSDAERVEADYYKLKLQAVDDLVNATPENSPQVSRQELKKFRAAPKRRVPNWVKAVLLKAWFAGVVCYFFIWGLSTFLLNPWDLLLILAVVLGGVTNLLTNSILRFIAREEGEYDRWMMFPGKSVLYLPFDVIYAAVLILCTVLTYNALNLLLVGPDSASAAVGVGPINFGIIVTLWDLLFLSLKRLAKRILDDAKEKVSKS